MKSQNHSTITPSMDTSGRPPRKRPQRDPLSWIGLGSNTSSIGQLEPQGTPPNTIFPYQMST